MDRFSEELYGNRSLPEGEVEPTCDNCGRVDYDLRRVDESVKPFHACDTCYEEIQALFDREAEGRELYPCDRQILAAFRKPLPAARKTITGGVMACVNCKTQIAGWNSLYCGKTCKSQFLNSLTEEVA
jgi:hypothetical protein